jgi:signal transduction histidine kinase/ActR/RegA family two-component response regulator
MPSGAGTVQMLPKMRVGLVGTHDAGSVARYAAELAGIAIAYLVFAKFGLALASLHPSASPIWPPTGFALAVVLLRGYRVWPAIFIAALIANATTAGSLATSAAIAAGNALEALVGAYLVNRWCGGRKTFAAPNTVAKFALICLAAATPVSATVGVGTLCLAGYAAWPDFAAIWLTWWLGDLTGAIVLTPVIVLWATDDTPSSTRAELAEFGAILAVTCALGIIAFSPLIDQTQSRDPLGFLAIVPLLWAALQRGQRETATVAFVLSCFAIWGTVAGGGPFWRTSLNDSFLLLLMFLITTTVPSLALSATVAIRRQSAGEAQAALEETRDQLAQAQKMEALGQLTGGIAHDFNNLLMIVSGHAQILQRRLAPAEPKNSRALDAILTAAKRGEDLTRQLLAFARRQRLNPQVIDLRDCLKTIRPMLASSLRDNITLTFDLPAFVWPVEVDVGELELAFVNIAVNARDAMPDGGVLSLSVRNELLTRTDNVEQLEGEFVALAWHDTGSGIAPEHLAKVFEPFFTTKPVGKGTGLGLSQVYGFARQSGGAVAVESTAGHGTTIKLYLQRSYAALSAASRTGDSNASLNSTAHGTVLIVEDNSEVAEVTGGLLEHLGYRALFARNAVDALQYLQREEKIDVILSDIVMPGGMNGIELAAEVRRRRPDIPVLLTSGYSEAARAAEKRYAILRKPFDLSDLVKALNEAMGRRAA